METGFSSDITWISVGDPIEIDQRCIYPVARVLASKGFGRILGCTISPEALMIVEPARTYVVSLTGQKITLDLLLAMAPSMKEIVDKEICKKYE